MAKTKSKSKPKELDAVYILKLVVLLILGSQWLRVSWGDASVVPFPIGALVGLLLVRFDRQQADLKFEYAVLVTIMFVGFWLPVGIDVAL